MGSMRAFLILSMFLCWAGLSLYVLQRESLHETAKLLLDNQNLEELHETLQTWEKIDPDSPTLKRLQGRFAMEKYLQTGESLWIEAGSQSFLDSLETLDDASGYYWLANLYKIAARVEGKQEYYLASMQYFKLACSKDPSLPYYYSLFFEMLLEFQKDSRFNPQNELETTFLENVSYALGNYMLLKDYYTKQYLGELLSYFPPAQITRVLIPVEAPAPIRQVLRKAYIEHRMKK